MGAVPLKSASAGLHADALEELEQSLCESLCDTGAFSDPVSCE